VLIGLAACLCLTACAPHSGSSAIDYSIFAQSPYELSLVFDLRVKDQPLAGLILEPKGRGASPVQLVLLPFKSREAVTDQRVLGSVGQYSDYTVVSYVPSQAQAGPFVFSFIPEFSPRPPDLPLGAELPGNIYLINDGLAYTFIYRYEPELDLISKLRGSIGPALRIPDAIGIALPEGATGRGIRNNRTAIPDAIHSTAHAQYFPASSLDPETRQLEVSYTVAESAGQERFGILVTKVLAVLATPFLTLLLLPSKDDKKPRFRLLAVTCLLVIQLALLIWFVVLPLLQGQTISSKIVDDLVVALSGAISTAAVLYVKR
jgi:hypothetical protein